MAEAKTGEEATKKIKTGEETRYDTLPFPFKVYFLVASMIGILLAVYVMFGFHFKGFTFYDAEYYFLLYALFGSCCFIILPEGKRLTRFDVALAGLTFALNIYFFFYGKQISLIGWVPAATHNLVIATILQLVFLYASRRASGGWIWPIIAVLFGVYPFFANYFPGLFKGISMDFTYAMSSYTFGKDGMLGLPGQVTGGILMGFLVFTGFLLATGGGQIFLDLAYTLVGRYRGGPAKVAVLGSGFFGSLSGSATANVVATGTFTIPAMKRLGYPPHYAAAVEACASTGGVVMPPVMGAVAFVAAALLGVPYRTIMMAAIIPSFLYYLGLLVQADAYAAKVGLKGLPKEEIPKFWDVVKRGWTLGFVLLFLVWGLLYMKWEYITPFYATGLLILLSFTSRKTMLTPKKFIGGLSLSARTITQMLAIMIPSGFVVAAVNTTGVGASFAVGIVSMGGASLWVVMLMGVAACYVMGMAGLLLTAYLFLALTMAPAMIEMGNLNVIAVHMFILYYSMIGFFTPPVAPAAWVAAAIARADTFKTGMQAMRLGIVLYFIPFFFVWKPALILQGSLLETLYLLILCVIGIVILAGGLEGYLLRVGKLELWSRPLLILGGFLIAMPEGYSSIIGAIITAVVLVVIFLKRRVKGEKLLVGGW